MKGFLGESISAVFPLFFCLFAGPQDVSALVREFWELGLKMPLLRIGASVGVPPHKTLDVHNTRLGREVGFWFSTECCKISSSIPKGGKSLFQWSFERKESGNDWSGVYGAVKDLV